MKTLRLHAFTVADYLAMLGSRWGIFNQIPPTCGPIYNLLPVFNWLSES